MCIYSYIFATQNIQGNMSTKVHQGKLLEKAIKESGISKSALVTKLKISRPTLYNLFKKEEISTDLLLKIGYLINHDFGKEINKPFKKKVEEKSAESEAVYWKNKYMELLEEQKNILTKLLDKK
jgi:plasmid maintenance system antidote protein VapI